MFCSNCGKPIPSTTARFCASCGAPSGGETSATTADADPRTRPAAADRPDRQAVVDLGGELALQLPLDLDAAHPVFERAFSQFNDGQVVWDATTETLSGRMYWYFASYPATLRLLRSDAGTVAELDVPKAKPAELVSIRARFADVLSHLGAPDFKPNKTGLGPWANFYAASPARRVSTLVASFVVLLAVSVGVLFAANAVTNGATSNQADLREAVRVCANQAVTLSNDESVQSNFVRNCVPGRTPGAVCDQSGIDSQYNISGLSICYFPQTPNDGVNVSTALLSATAR